MRWKRRGIEVRAVYAAHGRVFFGVHRDKCVDEALLMSRECRITLYHVRDEVVEIFILAYSVLGSGE